MTKNEGKVLNIVALAMKCNEVKIHAFIRYSPNINMINISAYLSEWGDEKEVDYEKTIYLDWEKAEEELIETEELLMSFIARSEF